MKRLIAFVFMFATVTCKAQNTVPYPDAEEVIATLFSSYQNISDITFYLALEKRKTGWHLKEMSGAENGRSHLFWDVSTKKYLPLPYDRRTDPATDIRPEVESFMQVTRIDEIVLYNFRRNVYYGYEGWDWDQIQLLKDRPALPDTMTEALARAYSNYAVQFFYNQWGNSSVNNDPDRIPLDDRAPVPVSRVKKFVMYQQKVIELYDRLQKRSPDYSTIVGPVYLKKANEHMFAFSTLLFAGYPQEAGSFIKGFSYPDSLLAIARNRLGDVKKDGILLTSGDNEFYSLWYLQEKGVRPDVVLLNYDLLGLRRAIQYFDRKHPQLFDIDSSVYMNPSLSYALYQPPAAEEETTLLKDFLSGICKGATVANSDEPKRFYYNTHKVFLEVSPDQAVKLYGKADFNEKLAIPVGNDYILLDGLMQLSLCSKNFLRRRIYFSYEIKQEDPEGIKQRGLLWELTPER